jgi:hypothetical protein
MKKTQCIHVCWLEQNKDCQNVEKSIIRIENVILETVEVSKLLGVNIDCCLTWSNHLGITDESYSLNASCPLNLICSRWSTGPETNTPSHYNIDTVLKTIKYTM